MGEQEAENENEDGEVGDGSVDDMWVRRIIANRLQAESEAGVSIGPGQTFEFFGQWPVSDSLNENRNRNRAPLNILEGEANDDDEYNQAMQRILGRVGQREASNSRDQNSSNQRA